MSSDTTPTLCQCSINGNRADAQPWWSSAQSDAIGAIALADTVKPEAKTAIEGLRRMGIEVELLTGDNPRAAQAVAEAVGIEHVLAEVTPSGKLEQIARLQREGHRVGMVGDGVNDAAALAQADLGIAMGTGVGAAIEAADISVLSGDLRGVARALRLARETYTIVLQNLSWAFGYNLIALPLAMTGLLSPALAAVAMGLSSITVVLNSLRLRRFGNAGRPTPVRSPRWRYASIVMAAVIPAVLLGTLVLADPDSFAVPRTASVTLLQPASETLEVYVEPLKPGLSTCTSICRGHRSATELPLDLAARRLRYRRTSKGQLLRGRSPDTTSPRLTSRAACGSSSSQASTGQGTACTGPLRCRSTERVASSTAAWRRTCTPCQASSRTSRRAGHESRPAARRLTSQPHRRA